MIRSLWADFSLVVTLGQEISVLVLFFGCESDVMSEFDLGDHTSEQIFIASPTSWIIRHGRSFYAGIHGAAGLPLGKWCDAQASRNRTASNDEAGDGQERRLRIHIYRPFRRDRWPSKGF